MAKSKTRAAAKPRAARKRPAAAKAPAKKAAAQAASGAEFLVVKVGNRPKVGVNMALLAVADSMEEARAKVDAMTGASPERVAILEKKAVLRRKPKIAVHEDKGNIVTG